MCLAMKPVATIPKHAVTTSGMRLVAPLLAAAVLSGCSMSGLPGLKPASPTVAALAPTPATRAAPMDVEVMAYAAAPRSSQVDHLIGKYAQIYAVPESLVRRVVHRESRFNPAARNGAYYGLMQISYATARTMGYSGTPTGLLDAETNLKYAVKYLRGAYIVAGYDADGAVRNYSRGYYYDAKAKGLLEEVGLR